jgi:hypothetical protein
MRGTIERPGVAASAQPSAGWRSAMRARDPERIAARAGAIGPRAEGAALRCAAAPRCLRMCAMVCMASGAMDWDGKVPFKGRRKTLAARGRKRRVPAGAG